MIGSDDLAERLAALRDRIAATGRAPDDIVVVAVTKGFGVDAVEAAAAVGLPDVGENYAQELVEKASASSDDQGRRWHFLGRVQRNKVRSIASTIHLWQGVDRAAAGEEIARRAPGARVLVQVRIDDGPANSGVDGVPFGRGGCHPNDVPALVERLAGLGLDVRGLMAVGPRGGPELARAGFRNVSALADRLGLPERSMGMTDDLDVAVQEGSTMVRVGRGLFGARPESPQMRR